MIIYTGASSLYKHDYTLQLQNILLEDSDDSSFENKHSSFSYILEKFLHTSGVGDIFEIINAILTFMLIIFYVISTYTYPETSDSLKSINKNINVIEIYVCLVLIIHFVIKFYSCQSRIYFMFDLICIVDYSTIVCIIIAQQKFVSEETKYFLRFFRMIRIIYLFKIEYIFQKRSETARYIYKLIVNIFTLFFLSSSLILEIENNNYRAINRNGKGIGGVQGVKGTWASFQFHDMIYFLLITISTTGFGDITPKLWMTKYIVVITLFGLLIFILPVYSKLETILTLSSKYSRIAYTKSSKTSKHLVVFGECGSESFKAFLEELYHEDHGNTNYDTVVMQMMPNETIMKLINSLPFANKIYYLVGNCLSHFDLGRCQAQNSICAVILANKLAKNPKTEDFCNIMKAFSFRKFNMKLKKGEASTRVCMQLLRPETKQIYFSSLVNVGDDNQNDQISCIEEIKMQLLGKSCLCPGITTIISSLITSKKPSIEESPELIEEGAWVKEYLEGIQLEIYVISLKAELIHNMRFIDLVNVLYQIAGLVIIGIDVIIDNIPPFVCLNPAMYFISPFDHFVYVLADYQPNENEINEMLRQHLESAHKGIVENNHEMVRLVRMKNPYWKKMGKTPEANRHNQLDSTKEDKKLETTKESKKLFSPRPNKEIPSGAYHKHQNSHHKLRLDLFNDSKKNFLLTTIPRTQHQAEVFSPGILTNHIVICGIGTNLKNLIMPLRASSMKHQQCPIVIIDKCEHIPSEIWKEIQYYPDIYFMQGNPIKAKDLHKAYIRKAKAVIILSKSSSSVVQADIVDADTIFIYKAIKNETKTALIIAELVSISSIGFINSWVDDSYVRKNGFWLCESFAMGEIYISSMLDTLICQAFYNPYISDILEQLIMGSSGDGFSPKIRQALKEKKIEQSTLFLVNIDEEIMKFGIRDCPKKVPFRRVFKTFVEHNMIPIGVNRNSTKLASLHPQSSKQYVFLCPKPDTLIDIEHDKIYILGGEEYFKKEYSKPQYLAVKDDYFKLTKASKLLDKTNELALVNVERIKKIVQNANVTLSHSFAPKKVVNCVRESFRNELSVLHDKFVDLGEDISKWEENSKDNKSNKTEEEEENDSKSEESTNKLNFSP